MATPPILVVLSNLWTASLVHFRWSLASGRDLRLSQSQTVIRNDLSSSKVPRNSIWTTAFMMALFLHWQLCLILLVVHLSTINHQSDVSDRSNIRFSQCQCWCQWILLAPLLLSNPWPLPVPVASVRTLLDSTCSMLLTLARLLQLQEVSHNQAVDIEARTGPIRNEVLLLHWGSLKPDAYYFDISKSNGLSPEFSSVCLLGMLNTINWCKKALDSWASFLRYRTNDSRNSLMIFDV